MKYFICIICLFVFTPVAECRGAEAILPIGVRLISMDEYHEMQKTENTPLLQQAVFEQEKPATRKERMFDKLFDNLDHNQDQQITDMEFSNSCRGQGRNLFGALDTNANRLIDRSEIEAYPALYVRLGCHS